MKSVLIVAAHPDDEVLGCGGTIAKHICDGDKVTILFMTNGVSARHDSNSEAIELRKNASIAALDALLVCRSNIIFGCFPDNQMDKVSLIEVVKKIEEVIENVNPSIIYTHFSDDLNIDHRITHQGVMTACRPQIHSSVNEIYCFEVVSSTEWNSRNNTKFNPNKYISIEKYWQKKLVALNAYSQEMRDFPHSRSIQAIEALCTWRGACVGLRIAEAFEIERIIQS